MFGKTSRALPSRRIASMGDQVAMALVLTLGLEASIHIPQLIQGLPSRSQQRSFYAALAEPVGSWAWLLQFGSLCALFLSYFYALAGLKHPRLRLSRLVLGAGACIAVVAASVVCLRDLGVPGVWLPVALPALWVSSQFGIGAAVVTYVAFVAVCSALGVEEFFAPFVLGRGVLLVWMMRSGPGNGAMARAGLAAAVGSGLILWLDPLSLPELSSGAEWGLLALGGSVVEVFAFWLTLGVGDRLLGHVSRERLVTLLDLSQPLLLRMMERAPGSFEHSRAMANLAEQAASAIGADALLTRVGAYYHDLGKSFEPKFFIENLMEGETSAHQGLTPLESAAHIVGHVTAGVRILRDAGIPEAIVEFSYTHHGSQHVEYFLNQHKKLHPNDAVDLRAFSYPGMRPSTKETAILMLVDSIEAAARTIDSRDRSAVSEMVSRIIFAKLSGGQLDDSGLTMAELRMVAARVVDTLVHMHHHRIKYPWQEDSAHGRPLTTRGLHFELPLTENSRATFPRPLGVA